MKLITQGHIIGQQIKKNYTDEKHVRHIKNRRLTQVRAKASYKTPAALLKTMIKSGCQKNSLYDIVT